MNKTFHCFLIQPYLNNFQQKVTHSTIIEIDIPTVKAWNLSLRKLIVDKCESQILQRFVEFVKSLRN